MPVKQRRKKSSWETGSHLLNRLVLRHKFAMDRCLDRRKKVLGLQPNGNGLTGRCCNSNTTWILLVGTSRPSLEGMEREHMPWRPRMQPNRLWRLWKKPSWEAKRLVLDRKRRQQRKLRALQQQLPDDVLVKHIFSKLSLQTLLHIRLTCKRWNRVILRRAFDGIEPRQSVVHILYGRSGDTIAVAHNPSTLEAIWRPIWWPRSSTDDAGWFAQVDGPFVVQVDEFYPYGGFPCCSTQFTVHNLLTKEYHVVSEPVPALSESEKRRSDPCLTLFGATKEDYKALMVTVITFLNGEDPTTHGAGCFYTHLYTSVTNTWRLINCTSLTDSDLGIQEGTGLPNRVQFSDGCFDGRFVFLTLNIHFEKKREDRLWAFELQDQTWTRIPFDLQEQTWTAITTDMDGSRPSPPYGFVRNIKYVTCMGKLLAVVTDVVAWINWKDIGDGEPMGRVTIFQFFGSPLQGVSTQCWKEISRSPPELLQCFNGIGLDEIYAVNEVIYFSPSVSYGGLRSRFAVVYNLRDNSWKKVSDSSNTAYSFSQGDHDIEYCVSAASDLVKYLQID